MATLASPRLVRGWRRLCDFKGLEVRGAEARVEDEHSSERVTKLCAWLKLQGLPDERLPRDWTSVKTMRSDGKSHDVYYFSPEGKRFRSMREVARHHSFFSTTMTPSHHLPAAVKGSASNGAEAGPPSDAGA